MLEGFRLSVDELEDVRLTCSKYLRYLSMIQFERYFLEMSIMVPKARFLIDIEEVQVQFTLYYQVLRDDSILVRVVWGRQ